MKPTDHIEEILNLAEQGLRPIEIARKLNLVPVSVSQFLNRNGYNYSFKNQGNIRYFQNIDTHEKAYVLGFIAADGYIVRSNKSSVTLGIQINKEDISILNFIRNQIGSEKELTYPNNKMVRFTLSNKELVQDLYNLGITQRKSLTLTNVLKYFPSTFHPSFIAGYLDGDGCICKNNQVRKQFNKSKNTIIEYPSLSTIISFRGTKALLEAFIPVIGLTNYSSFHDGKTWNLRFSKHSEVIKFYNLYKKSPFKLNRKFNKLEAGVNLIFSKYLKDQTISSSFLKID